MGAALAAALAGWVGAAVMTLELTAVRLLAPHFGDSAYVWTNVIGVILVGLALGAFLGGRLAHPDLGRRRLGIALICAAVFTALIPLWSGPLGAYLLPQDLPLDAAMPALVRGSLVATALLFAPPVLFLGCVTPLLITSLAAVDGRVGRAAGAVGAASTLGSLVGTFAATHYLVPEVGSRGTVWVAAAVLGACAVACLIGRPRAAAAAVAVVIAALGGAMWSLAETPLRPAEPGYRLIAERESRYQFLQVMEREEDGARLLKINEGLDSAHSVALRDPDAPAGEFRARPFTGGWYYDYFAATPYLAGDRGEVPPDLKVLSLGDAAGTFGRLFAHCFPGVAFDGVELDPATAELGMTYFGGLPELGRSFGGLDARVFVNRAEGPYHVVLLDAYENQVYIPAHVASVEFFERVSDLLAPGGVVAVNAGGIGLDAPVPAAVCATMAEVFGGAWAFVVPRSRNLMLVARKGQPLQPVAQLDGIASGDSDLDAVLERVSQPIGWRQWTPAAGGDVLTDDRPLLDQLLEDSMATAATPGLVVVEGDMPAAEAIAEARPMIAAGDGGGARDVLVRATEATAEVRYWLGAARWADRDLAGARVEYREALRLGGSGPFGDAVQQQLDALALEAGPRQRAAEISRRNGWLAMGIALLGVFAAAGLYRWR